MRELIFAKFWHQAAVTHIIIILEAYLNLVIKSLSLKECMLSYVTEPTNINCFNDGDI